MEPIIYQYEDVEQYIAARINTGLSFPEKIRITRAEVYTFKKVPRKKVWKDGTGRINRQWSFPTWLRVYDQEGFCGEAPLMGNDALTLFLPMMLSDPTPRTNLEWRRIFYWRIRGNSANFNGLSTMEQILFDLIARRRNIPMHRLLGATKDWTDCYKGGGSVLRTDEELVEEILSVKEEGFKGSKMKISLNTADRDIRRVHKVREAVGDDFYLAIDSNQGLDANAAMNIVRNVHDCNIAWYEEPVDAADMDELKKLCDMMKAEDCEIPVAMGESAKYFYTYRDYIDAGAKVIQPLPSMYTLAEVLRTIEYARSRGCRITTGQNYYPGCLLGALLKEGELIEFHRPNFEEQEPYFLVRSTLKDGRMYLPDIPGIPIRMDLEKLKAEDLLADIKEL